MKAGGLAEPPGGDRKRGTPGNITTPDSAPGRACFMRPTPAPGRRAPSHGHSLRRMAAGTGRARQRRAVTRPTARATGRGPSPRSRANGLTGAAGNPRPRPRHPGSAARLPFPGACRSNALKPCCMAARRSTGLTVTPRASAPKSGAIPPGCFIALAGCCPSRRRPCRRARPSTRHPSGCCGRRGAIRPGASPTP